MAEAKKEVREIPINWDRFHNDTRGVIKNLPRRRWSALVMIKRGGLIPGAIFARELDIRRNIGTLGIASYHDYKNQGGIEVYDLPSSEILALPHEEIIVVDDVCDTGRTYDYIQKHILPGAYYVATYVKPQGRPFAKLYGESFAQTDWLVFPWDMGLSLRPPLAQQRGEAEMVSS